VLETISPSGNIRRVSAPDPARLVHRFIGLVNRKSAGESTALMHRSGLTMPQIVVLFALRRKDASISQLAARLRMSLPATSQLVDRLVEAELIDRAEDPEDRRVKRIRIRPSGLRFLERLGELRRREVDDALASLAPGTRARLASALDEAVDELEAELERPPAPDSRRRRS
jgi:DNA-binding MarR family transcriptional regulator